MPYGVIFSFTFISCTEKVEKTTTQHVENPNIVIQMRINRFRSCFFFRERLQPSRHRKIMITYPRTLILDREITRRFLTAVLWLFRRFWGRRHLRAEALDGLQACAPVSLHLDLHGVALCVLEDRGEPVCEEAELAYE